LANTADCQTEANGNILSAIGQDGYNCSFSYVKLLESKKSHSFLEKIDQPYFWLLVIINFLFTFLGLFFLIRAFCKEKEEKKKYFLCLNILYWTISFLVMIPAIASGLAEYRYFIQVFFVPFLFLGFILLFLNQKFPRKKLLIAGPLLLFLIASNAAAIGSLAKELRSKSRSDSSRVVLGEIEPMVEYVIAESNGQREAYFVGNGEYVANFSKAFTYLAQKQNFKIINYGKDEEISEGMPVFYIWKNNGKLKTDEFGGRKIEDSENFGQVGIYKLQN
jgi:hypothetical protein